MYKQCHISLCVAVQRIQCLSRGMEVSILQESLQKCVNIHIYLTKHFHAFVARGWLLCRSPRQPRQPSPRGDNLILLMFQITTWKTNRCPGIISLSLLLMKLATLTTRLR